MIVSGTLLWLGATFALGLVLAAVTAVVSVVRQRTALNRVAEGLDAMLAGNDARRIVVPDGGLPSRIATQVNALAERTCAEREERSARDDAQRQLLANISHDLRTPLTAIAGYADALARGLGDDPDRYLAVLSAKTAELSRLTDDLFYLTRMDAGDISLERIAFDLAEETASALLAFETEISSAGIDVITEMPEGPCVVDGDPSAVRRVLSNLVSNALRHARGMSRLTVRVGTGADGGCFIEVADDGAGFTAPVARLLERGVAEGGGSGLGLAIVKGLAERMGGRVDGESVPGVRTAFVVSFPRGGDRG